MAESEPSPDRLAFEHVPNRRMPAVIESYCPNCGLFVGASHNPQLLEVAELAHTCCEWLKFF